jgi:hypothetical protein
MPRQGHCVPCTPAGKISFAPKLNFTQADGLIASAGTKCYNRVDH